MLSEFGRCLGVSSGRFGMVALFVVVTFVVVVMVTFGVSVVVFVVLFAVSVVSIGPLDLSFEVPVLALLVAGDVVVGIAAFEAEFVFAVFGIVSVLEVSVVLLFVASTGLGSVVGQDVGHRHCNQQKHKSCLHVASESMPKHG